MKVFEDLCLQFEEPLWAISPDFAVMDVILEKHPEIIKFAEADVTVGLKNNGFGRGDTPSVEQIVRMAIFKEFKNLDYRELEFAQSDSRLCEHFCKIDSVNPFSFQLWHKYISRIKKETLEKVLIRINRVAIDEGIEDVSQFRQDSTAIETNIHYPTNNSLVWDCIKEAHRLFEQLKEEVTGLEIKDYRKAAKKNYFKINVTKNAEERVLLFQKQLKQFSLSMEQVAKVIKKKSGYCVSVKAAALTEALEHLLEQMGTVYRMTYRHEIKKEKVPVEEKLFSIYEEHTDIIVKGGRKAEFGHKVNIGTGKSNLILTCEVVEGNPCDRELYQGAIKQVKKDYRKTPKSSVTDGGYASLVNLEWARKQEIVNIVFNKIVGSLKNVATSIRTENKLKRWRAGIEAVISNLKRGFNISRCVWKGFEHFKQKVLWSVIGYNIRVLTAAFLAKMVTL
jgi:IS5 family transposase